MKQISNIYRIIISSLLALLGFSCGKFFRESGVEYGSPYATYKAKGIVVSEADDSPIKGIKTILRTDWQDDDDWPLASAYTNNDGSFFMTRSEFPQQKLYVKLIDVDGEENGLFTAMEVEADYTNETLTGGSEHWYNGEAELDLGIIKMKPDNNPENKD